jgi:hypothetical protein
MANTTPMRDNWTRLLTIVMRIPSWTAAFFSTFQIFPLALPKLLPHTSADFSKNFLSVTTTDEYGGKYRAPQLPEHTGNPSPHLPEHTRLHYAGCARQDMYIFL